MSGFYCYNMIKGGNKIKKTAGKKTVKSVNLTVKVRKGTDKAVKKMADTENKSVLRFDKPADIKKQNQTARKNIFSLKKKKADKGFIRAGIESDEELSAGKKKADLNSEKENTALPKAKPAVILSARTEADKKMILYGGVGFCMLVILVIWIFQVKYTIGQTKITNENPEQDLHAMISDVSDKIKQMKDDLEIIKSYDQETASGTDEAAAQLPLNFEADTAEADNVFDAAAATSTDKAAESEELIETEVIELKKKLEESL